jgi:hypothetical protein
LRALLLPILLAGCAAAPFDLPQDKPQEKQQSPTAAPEPKWELSGYAMMFSPPHDSTYVAPVLMADRGPLHLEARYQYEARDSASVWAGWNFDVGTDFALAATPMVGFVFGDTEGVAPGYRLTAAWKQLDATTEGEYLLSFDDSNDNFFYSWTEVGWSPVKGIRAGVVGQRTHTYHTDREVDRGFLLQLNPGRISVGIYVFEPWDNDRYVSFSVGTSL